MYKHVTIHITNCGNHIDFKYLLLISKCFVAVQEKLLLETCVRLPDAKRNPKCWTALDIRMFKKHLRKHLKNKESAISQKTAAK